MTIKETVDSYKTKYKQGFTSSEVDDIVKTSYSDINMDKFNNALRGNTCMLIDNEIIFYHCDIIKALKCGVENRDLYPYEWD